MTRPHSSVEASPRSVTEGEAHGPVPSLVHPEWRERWPWLVQGLTTPGPERDRDFRLFAGPGEGAVERWGRLGPGVGSSAVVHGEQPHGAGVLVHGSLPPGLHLSEPVDAHATRHPGLLVTVTVADCVPVFFVAGERRIVALAHAGWRGAAAGILETTVSTLRDRFGLDSGELSVHLGPSICGACYEVGAEVHEGLGEPVPSGPAPVDLRANLARRAARAGVPEAEITVSTHCTRCGPVDLFSHRGGDRGRQVAFLGRR